jgi:hypothetical protein
VLDGLLPVLRERYGSDPQSSQEDWGWFAWFEKSAVKSWPVERLTVERVDEKYMAI